jgi:hypothetical protein
VSYTVSTKSSFIANTATIIQNSALWQKFGSSIASSQNGDVFVIGGPGNSPGSAWVFSRTGSASWSKTSLYGYNSVSLGKDVAISMDGSTVFVGDPGWNNGQGCILVYKRPDYGWLDGYGVGKSAVLSANVLNGGFGEKISLNYAGDTLLVTAWGYNSQKGCAYIYKTDASGNWVTASTPYATLTDTRLTTSNYFGYDAGMSGDGSIVVVGAYGYAGGKGAVFIYNKGSAWSDRTIANALLAETTTTGGYGTHIAIGYYGTIILVGAILADSQAGRVYIYNKGSAWSDRTTADSIIYCPDNLQTRFSGSLAVDDLNGQILVGHEEGGPVYIYDMNGQGWILSNTLQCPDNGQDVNYGFGSCVKYSPFTSNFILIGAPNAGTNPRVYVYA